MTSQLNLTPGVKLHASVGDAQIVVIRAPDVAIEITCAGAPMTLDESDSSQQPANSSEEVLIGKRYVDSELHLEVLCTRSGYGPLMVADRELEVLEPRPIPSSD